MVPALYVDTSTLLAAALLLKSCLWILLCTSQTLFTPSKITDAPKPTFSRGAAARRRLCSEAQKCCYQPFWKRKEHSSCSSPSEALRTWLSPSKPCCTSSSGRERQNERHLMRWVTQKRRPPQLAYCLSYGTFQTDVILLWYLVLPG